MCIINNLNISSNINKFGENSLRCCIFEFIYVPCKQSITDISNHSQHNIHKNTNSNWRTQNIETEKFHKFSNCILNSPSSGIKLNTCFDWKVKIIGNKKSRFFPAMIFYYDFLDWVADFCKSSNMFKNFEFVIFSFGYIQFYFLPILSR